MQFSTVQPNSVLICFIIPYLAAEQSSETLEEEIQKVYTCIHVLTLEYNILYNIYIFIYIYNIFIHRYNIFISYYLCCALIHLMSDSVA